MRNLLVAVGIIGAAALTGCGGGKNEPAGSNGQETYNLRCASCHGQEGQGSQAGTRLDSLNLTDQAITAAVVEGVQSTSREWPDMPGMPDLNGVKLDDLVGYLQSLQTDT